MTSTTPQPARSALRPGGLLRVGLVLLVSVAMGLLGTPVPAHAARPDVTVTLRLSDANPVRGEMIWVRGKVRTKVDRRAVRAATVRIERKTRDGWTRIATRKTNRNGAFTLRTRPETALTLRARVLKSSDHRKGRSPERQVRPVRADRTLQQRAAALGKRTGKARGAASSARITKQKRATWRNYRKVLLVEVAGPKKTRTWLVQGDIRTAYRKAGGPRGRLGAPLGDPRCGLREAGCVQRFRGGAIYDNRNTRKATVVYGTGRRTEVLAAAKSQVGYAASARDSKFNRWMGSSGRAWCATFLSWVAVAAGRPDTIPKHPSLRGLHRDLRANAPERFGTKPKRGALVFFDNDDDGVRDPTHIGIVLRVQKNTIVTVEGNTSNPATRSGRGVYEKVRAKSHPIYYWYPRY